MATDNGLPADWFERLDTSPDHEFYREPRFVQHIDPATISALTDYYTQVLFAGARVLDLMSSWVSHLPAEPALGHVSGLGMNAAELASNPRLDDHLVQDLNEQPQLPYPTASFDRVLIAVSVQYLVQPLEVLAEVARVLVPGGKVVVAMSHRCFPTKAIRAFHAADGATRMQLLEHYFDALADYDRVETLDRSPPVGDPLWLVVATRS